MLIAGIDFSGSAKAGHSIWACTAEIRAKGILVTDLLPARDLPGGGPGREEALTSLVEFLLARGELLVGMDFPFALPKALQDHPEWPEFVLKFAEMYPSAEAFRDRCRKRAGGKELKRRVEAEARVPFASYNLRLYRQAFYGIREVLAPLLRSGALYTPGLMPECKRRITAFEACPACWLKRRGMYLAYKGNTADARSNRSRILGGIESECQVGFAEKEFEEIILANAPGDALDALLAALCVWSVKNRLEEPASLPDEGLIAC